MKDIALIARGNSPCYLVIAAPENLDFAGHKMIDARSECIRRVANLDKVLREYISRLSIVLDFFGRERPHVKHGAA